MRYRKVGKEQVLAEIQKIYEKDKYISVVNIRKNGLYYLVRKYWGGVEGLKKYLAKKYLKYKIFPWKRKIKKIDIEKHYQNILNAINAKNYKEFRQKIGSTYYFLLYSYQSIVLIQKIENTKIKNKRKILEYIRHIEHKKAKKADKIDEKIRSAILYAKIRNQNNVNIKFIIEREHPTYSYMASYENQIKKAIRKIEKNYIDTIKMYTKMTKYQYIYRLTAAKIYQKIEKIKAINDIDKIIHAAKIEILKQMNALSNMLEKYGLIKEYFYFPSLPK